MFERCFGSTPTDLEGASVVRVQRITTPPGPMLAGATDDALFLLKFVDRRDLVECTPYGTLSRHFLLIACNMQW